MEHPYLGAKIRAQRKSLGVLAKSVAGAARVSRLTLRRIEKGESSVSLEKYLRVCEVLGLYLDILISDGSQRLDTSQSKDFSRSDGRSIRIEDYPQLKALAWQLDSKALLSEHEAMCIYERNRRFLELEKIEEREKLLMQRLIEELGMDNLLK